MLGGGAAGLSVAFGSAAVGIDVGLVERDRLGGECTWTGCVPSKTLADVGRRAHEAGHSRHLGLAVEGLHVDFDAVMSHIRSVSEHVSHVEDEAALKEAGVAVYLASASFVDPHTVALDDGTSIGADRIVIATGAVPIVPDALLPGGPLTSETIWELEALPERLVVVGGGPVGVEMAQAFRRLGSDVVVVTDADRLLWRDHPDASSTIAARLEREGVEIRTGSPAVSARRDGASVSVELDDGSVVAGSHLLVSIGRRSRLGGLALDAAGIEVDESGDLVLDRSLRTSQPHISAVGDAGGGRFTHVAGDHAMSVLWDVVVPIGASHSHVPRWATFTDPEIAQVGEWGGRHTTRLPMDRLDRAVVGDARTGFIEVSHTRTGRIRGVTVVGRNAAELADQWIPHIGRWMTAPLSTPAIYPTLGSSNAILAFEWLSARLSSPPGRLLGHAVSLWTRLLSRLRLPR